MKSPTLPFVIRFSEVMEQKLAANRHKGDRAAWLKDHPFVLFERIEDEMRELWEKMDLGYSPDEVERECADVANFAMMVADSYREKLYRKKDDA